MKGQEYCKGVSTYMSEDSDNKDGQVVLEDKNGKKIKLITIIGEIEGHDNLPAASKTTKYEHLLPQLAAVENDDAIGGVLFLMNTVGGDVSAGLALSEMIASMHKPTVSLVIGDSHSIGVPLAVSTDYSFIVPTATMIVHPVRMNGNIIGARQTYDYFERIQKRIVSFIARKSDTKEKEVENMMMNTEMLTKDLGTILVGEDAVKAGLINEVGGISHAFNKIKELMNKGQKQGTQMFFYVIQPEGFRIRKILWKNYARLTELLKESMLMRIGKIL